MRLMLLYSFNDPIKSLPVKRKERGALGTRAAGMGTFSGRVNLAYHVVGKDLTFRISDHLLNKFLHLLLHFGQEPHRDRVLVWLVG